MAYPNLIGNIYWEKNPPEGTNIEDWIDVSGVQEGNTILNLTCRYIYGKSIRDIVDYFVKVESKVPVHIYFVYSNKRSIKASDEIDFNSIPSGYNQLKNIIAYKCTLYRLINYNSSVDSNIPQYNFNITATCSQMSIEDVYDELPVSNPFGLPESQDEIFNGV